MSTFDAIVLAGGSGNRFSAGGHHTTLKQFHPLHGRPVLAHSIQRIFSVGSIRRVVVAAPTREMELTRSVLSSHLPESIMADVTVISGGDRRQDSSRLALKFLEEGGDAPDRVLIHDGCRPYLSPDFVQRIHDCLRDRSYGAWVPVVPVTETLKRVENQQVVETVDRQTILRVQTPQVFEFAVIRSLSEQAREMPETSFTDDASLCEYYGIPVGTFEGDPRNVKLTYQFELASLEHFLKDDGQEALPQTPCESESDTTFTA